MSSAALQRLVRTGAAQNQLSAKLVDAVITVESHGDPSAVSATGAAGLMQLMPETALTYGVGNRFDPDANVTAGCRYLHDLLARYHNNLSLALAAYNAGPGAVDAHHGVPSFPETRAYVARVSAAMRNSTF
jgi:soluble lytic murein transglycosylase-like protein